MAEQRSGIDLMRRRIERASRQPPPSRRAGAGASPSEPPAGEPQQETPAESATSSAQRAPAPSAGRVASPRAQAPARRGVGERRRRLSADLPSANLAIRVRAPLDDDLVDTIHALRGRGVRTSKVELIEMLLWESAGADPDAMRERLRVFREWAPRGAGARLDD